MSVGSLLANSDDFAHAILTKEGRAAMRGKSGLAYGLYAGARRRPFRPVMGPLAAGARRNIMQAPAGAGALRRMRFGTRQAGRYAGRGFGMGWHAAIGGYAFMTLPAAMLETGQAEHGHKLSTFSAQALPWFGTMLGQAAFGGVGGLVGGLALDAAIKTKIGRGLQKIADYGRGGARLEMGGYQDTEAAYTMRQRGAIEMGRSLLNARSELGREAALLHS
jgi:hypothetical protein